MSDRRIGSITFADLLAGSIADDPTVKACADSLDAMLDRATKAIPDLLIFARLANDSGFVNPVPMLPPMERLAELSGGLKELATGLLDLLAWQLHVESYDTGVNLEAKRKIIQASLLLHRRHGTPWSLRHALETLLQVPATLPEWFQYGGKPYFFRARLDVTGVGVDIHWIISALQIIMDYKNARSWLEYLETFSVNPLPVFAAMSLVARSALASRLWQKPNPMPAIPVFAGMASIVSTSYAPSPQPPAEPVPLAAMPAIAAISITRSVICPTN